jgi:hypothetical protein
MRIERKAITEDIQARIYLLKPQNERFLKWEKLIFWDDVDKLEDDFPARIPVTILFSVLLLLTGFNLVYQDFRYQIFAGDGVVAQEEISNKETSTLRNASIYYLSYRYNYDNEQFTRTIETNRAAYENAVIGSQREVLLLRSNRDLMIGSLNELLIPLLLSLIVFMIIFLLSVYKLFRWYRKIPLIPAKITEVEHGEKHSNRGVHQTFEISYEFASPRSKALLKSRHAIPIREDAPSTEQLLAVLYRNDTDFLPL